MTGSSSEDPLQQAVWRLQPAALQQRLSQTAIVPLTRAGLSTIEDVKKNGQLLLTSAQTALQKQKNGFSEDWQLLKRVGTPAEARRSAKGSMRRVASDTNFQRAHHLRLQRPPGGSPLSREQEQQRQADAWDWLTALNSTLNQARAAQQSKFERTRTGLEQQVRRRRRRWRRRC